MLLPKNSRRFTNKNFYAAFDCHILLVDITEINEIYQIKKNSKMIYSKIGIWNSVKGLNISDKNYYKRRMNFQQEEMVMISNDKVWIACSITHKK